MATITKWLRKAVDAVIDPDREERVNLIAQVLERGLHQHRQKFRASAALGGFDYTSDDLTAAKERVFRSILERGWKDGKLSPGQQKITNWVADSLEISRKDAYQLNLEFARQHFGTALGHAMEDGVLEEHEIGWLQQIASSVDLSVPQFVRGFFFHEGESFLRGIFLACVSDGRISDQEWWRLLETTKQLGITREELLEAIQPQAHQFVEHVLADAKADGLLSTSEKDSLYWLLNNLHVPAQFHNYVLAEVDQLQILTDLQDGKLPRLPAPAGSAVHELTNTRAD